MKIIKIHKSKLFHLEGNPRKIIDKNGAEKLQYLIKKHGFQGWLEVFRKGKAMNYEIIVGNHRFDAAVALGITVFPCIEFKGTRKEALARALSDNKSSEWTEWDIPKLKDILTDIDDGKTNMEMTGFEQEEIDELFENISSESSGEESEFETCPECGKKL